MFLKGPALDTSRLLWNIDIPLVYLSEQKIQFSVASNFVKSLGSAQL